MDDATWTISWQWWYMPNLPRKFRPCRAAYRDKGINCGINYQAAKMSHCHVSQHHLLKQMYFELPSDTYGNDLTIARAGHNWRIERIYSSRWSFSRHRNQEDRLNPPPKHGDSRKKSSSQNCHPPIMVKVPGWLSWDVCWLRYLSGVSNWDTPRISIRGLISPMSFRFLSCMGSLSRISIADRTWRTLR